VAIKNEGMRHVIASGARVRVGGETGITLSSRELGRLAGANYLPGMSMSLFVPDDRAVEGREYEAQIEYERVY
jgi:hypothetical protein